MEDDGICSLEKPDRHLGQQPPTFLAPGTGFMEDSLSTNQREGDGFGMI